MTEREDDWIGDSHSGSQEDEFLTFCLGDEDYGVDILRVVEIRGWEPVTRIPNAPGYVQGVVNLRGSIVPVFDLRMRLNMPRQEYGKQTVVIVLRIKTDHGEKNIGIVVDSVSDVLHANVGEIQKTPNFGNRLETNHIAGLANAGEKMIMLLDVDSLQPSAVVADDDANAA
jgi:purine-binding chemotaxis protein CheW